jgi:hypothetical protein
MALATLNINPDAKKIINAYTERFDFYSAGHFVDYMLQLIQVHFIITRGGVEESVQLVYLPPKLKDGWIIKGIKTEEFVNAN